MASVMAKPARELEVGSAGGDIVIIMGEMGGSADERMAFNMDPLRALETAQCLISLALECSTRNRESLFADIASRFTKEIAKEEEHVEPRERQDGEGNPWATPTEEDHAVRREDDTETNVHRET